jgi:hypothetical protein
MPSLRLQQLRPAHAIERGETISNFENALFKSPKIFVGGRDVTQAIVDGSLNYRRYGHCRKQRKTCNDAHAGASSFEGAS